MQRKISKLQIIYLAIFIILLILFAFNKIDSNDFWWHLKLGEMILYKHSFLTTDIFSFTKLGVTWFYNSHLFDTTIWLIFKISGWFGIFAFRFIIYLATFYFIYKTIKLKKIIWPYFWTGAFLILLVMNSRHLFRPELVLYLFTSIYLYLLYAYKYKNYKAIYFLPLLQILWVNSHATFILGIILIGIFLLAELIRLIAKHKIYLKEIITAKYFQTYLIIFLLTLLANFISPYGYKIFGIMIQSMLGDAQESFIYISEWSNQVAADYLNLQLNPLLGYKIILVLGCIILLAKIRQLLKQKSPLKRMLVYFPYEDIFLFIVFLYLSMNMSRFSLVNAMVVMIIILKHLPGLINKKRILYNYKLQNSLVIFSIVLFFIIVPVQQWKTKFGLGYLPNRYSEGAVEFIKNHQISGNMLNHYNEGGYLIWALYPDKPVFIDGRTPNVYDDDFYWRWRNLSDENIRQQIVTEHDINFWLWPHNNELQKILWNDEQWQLIYADQVSTIYIKNIESNQELIDKFGYKFFAPYFTDTDIEQACNEKNIAQVPDIKNKFITELETGLEANPNNWLNLKNLATVYQKCQYDEQDLPKIKQYLLQAYELNPSDQQLAYQLGFISLDLTEYEQALRYFEQSKNQQANYLVGLGTAQYNLGQYKKALKTLLKARVQNGILDNKYYQILGRTYYMLGQDKQAIKIFHRYIDLTHDFSAASYTDLAQSYFYDGQIEEAKNYLTLALNLESNYQLALDLQAEME